uniref:formate dehydrogenase accessory sulfurtransferase FdhD n=1 Tax=Undibacterium sp. TaxID=1914977 RepID=UPI0037521A1D
DMVAVEVPVALVFNGIAFAVMMVSPIDLEDFAYGFSFTEGIIDHAKQIYDCEHILTEQGHTLELNIATEQFARLKERKRNLAGRTGCGLCGVESLAQAIQMPAALQSLQSFHISAITSAVKDMKTKQSLLEITGATHAAAWCNAAGNIDVLREDVGRHNALDKVIGALLRNDKNPAEGFLAITSRASYEMVQKTAIAGVPLLAAVSGVTNLAIQIAEQSGVALLGFTRGNDVSIYSHTHRINMDEQ